MLEKKNYSQLHKKIKITIKNNIKYVIYFIFSLFGYRLSNDIKGIDPVDFRDTEVDPRSIGYLVNRQAAIIDAPTELGRGLPLFSFSVKSIHPYVCAVSAALRGSPEESLSRITNILSTYYDLVQPLDAVSLLGLEYNDAPKLIDKPSWAAPMPWERSSLEEWSQAHQLSVQTENSLYDKDLSIFDGWAWVGPVSKKKLIIEAHRLNCTFTSIVKNGYKRHDRYDGDILATMLIGENGKWCWQALTGQHRATVLVGLGKKSIPIRIVKVVSRNEAEFWPNVRSSLYSKRVALKVFDKVITGEIPKLAVQWSNYVQKNNL